MEFFPQDWELIWSGHLTEPWVLNQLFMVNGLISNQMEKLFKLR